MRKLGQSVRVLMLRAFRIAAAVSARRATERAFSWRCLSELEQESMERFAAEAI